LFRKTAIGGQWLITRGIAALPALEQWAIMEKVRRFDTFTPDNDPYGEHDFGALEHQGQRIFWKIDYYAPGLRSQRGRRRPVKDGARSHGDAGGRVLAIASGGLPLWRPSSINYSQRS